MFSKSSSEIKKNNPLQVEDFIPQNTNFNQDEEPLNINLAEINEQPETVKLVEKISGILSPYFIVIVGLYLYDDNFFFGGILIIVGILSLLKVSYQDIVSWIDKIKRFFNQNQTLS